MRAAQSRVTSASPSARIGDHLSSKAGDRFVGHSIMEATVRRELIAAALTTLLSCNPVFAQVGGIGSAAPGMGPTSPFGMSAAASGSVGPAGIPLGASELATPGLSPAPPGTLGSGFTVCSAVVGAGSNSATGVFDGGGAGTSAGTSMGTSQMGMGGTSSASGACNQASGASSTGTLPSTPSSAGPSAPLGIGTIPMGSTELDRGGVSPSPCPLSGPTLPTDGSIAAQGSC
jgi:hypothetical protein